MAFSNDKCKSFYRVDNGIPEKRTKDHMEHGFWKMKVETVSWKEYNEQLKIYQAREAEVERKIRSGEIIA
jgi:hypothetical protein